PMFSIHIQMPSRSICPDSKNTAPNRTGTSSAPIQNHLFRTRSTNSRRTIAQILRIGSHAGLYRLRAYQVDENFQERRLAQLEARQPRSRPDQVAQHPLRVGPGGELDLGVLTVVIDFFDDRRVGKDSGRRSHAAVEPDDEMVSTACPL